LLGIGTRAATAAEFLYCQKPISVDIAEGQAMLAAARKHNRVVQIGTQRRSTGSPGRSPGM